MARIGVVFGGRSVEHRVSVTSARTVAAGLAAAGHEVVPLGIAQDGCWVDAATAARALTGEIDALPAVGRPVAPTLSHLVADPPEALFPIVHGSWGEDGTLQGLAEMLDLPYVGAGVGASAAAMDKLAAKRLCAAAGLPVVDYEPVTAAGWEDDPDGCLERARRLPSPWFVKPASGGSSVGVRKVAAAGDLGAAIEAALGFDEAVLVERAVRGRELECAVLGGRRLEASAVGEIVPGREFYDYEDKYLADDAGLIAPAELAPATAAEVRRLAVAAFAALGGWGFARVDFFLESAESPGAGGGLWINEVNTLPGFTRISMFPRLWALSGVALPELVGRLVELAFERHRERRRRDAAIGRFLTALNG